MRNHKQYARVDLIPPVKKSKEDQDKIARLYGLAAKLGVKIGAEDGKEEDRRRNLR